MKRFSKAFALGVVTLSIFLFGPLVNADENHFTGLWEAIDAEDGSPIVVSIIDNQPPDGVYEILWRETHFFRCEKKGQGIIRGTAQISMIDGALEMDAQLYCLDGSKGTVLVRPTLYLGNNDTTLATDNGSLTLHRISTRE